MPRLSTSSWSLHRSLGRPPLYGPDDPGPAAGQSGDVSLLELPARLARLDIGTLEIVHFHFPTTEPGYLAELRTALDEANVELFSILIDAGDITHPDPDQRQRALTWIQAWIDVAAGCGASHARVVAGYTPVERNGIPPAGAGQRLKDHPVLQLSAENLRALAGYASLQNVHIITENFRETGSRSDQLLALLDLCEGDVGLCVDFGNFKGADKYDELAALFPHADSAHVKALYDADGHLDQSELTRSLSLLTSTDFDGPMSLIFDTALHRGETEWDNLATLRDIVLPYTAM